MGSAGLREAADREAAPLADPFRSRHDKHATAECIRSVAAKSHLAVHAKGKACNGMGSAGLRETAD